MSQNITYGERWADLWVLSIYHILWKYHNENLKRMY